MILKCLCAVVISLVSDSQIFSTEVINFFEGIELVHSYVLKKEEVRQTGFFLKWTLAIQ